MVELITQKGHIPSKRWLKIVKTEGAKSRIKSFFYKKERDKYIELGKEMLISECKKKNIDISTLFTEENVKKLTTSLNLDTLDDIYFSISTLRYLPSTVLNKIETKTENKKKLPTIEKKVSKNGILIAGSSDILCTLATCCNPVYGEDIVGYITKGYGVKVHSKHCPNIDLNSERTIEASWIDHIDTKYPARIKIYIEEIGNLLVDIVSLATKYDITIDSVNLINRNKELFYDINCKVRNIEKLNSFIEETKLINSISSIERVFI